MDKTTTPEYNAWRAMKVRCYNPRSANYRRYGGRGITVCDKWRRSFSAFLADMGLRPGTGLSLDRRNNSGNYEPGNCRWATPKQQMRNTRSNRRLSVNGAEKCVIEWAEVLGVNARTIRRRLDQYHMDPKSALRRRVFRRVDTLITHEGLTLTVGEWSRRVGLSRTCLSGRLHKGWSAADVLFSPKQTHKRGGQGSLFGEEA